MTRKICVATGTRAEYGLLRWVMEGIRDADDLTLQLVVTGAHLSPEFGLTHRDITTDGFSIDRQVDMMLRGDTPSAITKSMGLALIGFGEAFSELAPNLLVVVGDRYEMLAAASAATIARIPIAHAHGGEVTEGAFDDAMRHAITKLSHLHFVAAAEYRNRVVQLGEDPARVFVVGGLGLDNIRKLQLLDRPALERELGFALGARNLLITFHPATLEPATAAQHVRELLAAVDGLPDTQLIFTMPNADPESRTVTTMLQQFAAARPNVRLFTSLGQRRYLSCMQHVDGVVGNSSSGVIEAPALKKGSVNIGNRQKGRTKAASVIDCAPERRAIADAIARLYDPVFRSALATVRNPYGDGGASERIVETIRTYPLDGLLKKSFFEATEVAQ